MGSLTAGEDHKLTIDFGFLEPGGNYEAVIYSYDPKIMSTTKIRIETAKTNHKTIKEFSVTANSGLAIHIRKI